MYKNTRKLSRSSVCAEAMPLVTRGVIATYNSDDSDDDMDSVPLAEVMRRLKAARHEPKPSTEAEPLEKPHEEPVPEPEPEEPEPEQPEPKPEKVHRHAHTHRHAT